jgi:cell division protein FtsL
MNFELFSRRVRGFRIANLVCGMMLLTTVLGVYLAKTTGGDQRSRIASVERQISDERDHIKLLRAEVAYLGRPDRLQTLAEGQLGLAPIAGSRRVSLDELARLAAPAEVQAESQVAAGEP